MKRTSEPSPETTCGIVVTYYPDVSLPGLVEKILQMVPRAIVVDNGSSDESTVLLRELSAKDDRITLVENQSNRGIAEALNQGICQANQFGCTWALLFDQDTRPYSDLFSILVAARQAHPSKERVALVGGMPVDERGQCLHLGSRAAYRPVPFVVTSGSLLSVSAFADAGTFRSDYFIDSVDREYGFRLRAAGYHVLLATRPAMAHVWGEPAQVQVGPLVIARSGHSALRRYYITRNWLCVIRRYLLNEPGAIGSEICYFLIDTTRAIALEPKGWRQLVAALYGIAHAAIGRMGQSHPHWLGNK